MAGVKGKRTRIPQHTYHGRVQRDLRIDNVRGVLIILVVIGHFLLPLAESNTRLISGIIYVIYAFHMPCFVMISGYYAKSVYRNGKFRWGKAVQMLWLYFVYKAILFVTEWLAYGYSGPPNFFKESGAPWYLMSLTLWYLTIPLLQRLRGSAYRYPFVLFLFVAVCFLKYPVQIGGWFSFDRTLTFFPFFCLGFLSTQNDLDRYLMSPAKRPVDLAAVFLVLLIFVGMKDLFMKYNLVVYGADYSRYLPELYSRAWLINLIWYVIALTISLGLIGMTLNRQMFLFTNLGKNTLQIYFLHRPVRDLLMYMGMYEMIDPFNRLHVLFLIIFSFGLTVLLGIGYISEWFRQLRTVFDPLLENHNAL